MKTNNSLVNIMAMLLIAFILSVGMSFTAHAHNVGQAVDFQSAGFHGPLVKTEQNGWTHSNPQLRGCWQVLQGIYGAPRPCFGDYTMREDSCGQQVNMISLTGDLCYVDRKGTPMYLYKCCNQLGTVVQQTTVTRTTTETVQQPAPVQSQSNYGIRDLFQDVRGVYGDYQSYRNNAVAANNQQFWTPPQAGYYVPQRQQRPDRGNQGVSLTVNVSNNSSSNSGVYDSGNANVGTTVAVGGPTATVNPPASNPRPPVVNPTPNPVFCDPTVPNTGAGYTVTGTPVSNTPVTVRDANGNLVATQTTGSNGRPVITPTAPVTNPTPAPPLQNNPRSIRFGGAQNGQVADAGNTAPAAVESRPAATLANARGRAIGVSGGNTVPPVTSGNRLAANTVNNPEARSNADQQAQVQQQQRQMQQQAQQQQQAQARQAQFVQQQQAQVQQQQRQMQQQAQQQQQAQARQAQPRPTQFARPQGGGRGQQMSPAPRGRTARS